MAQSDDKKDPESAFRMRALRVYLRKGSSAEMADLFSIDPRRWNNYEQGMPVAKDMARRIKERVQGIDLDWIDHGDLSGVPGHMHEALKLRPPPLRPRKPQKPQKPTKAR